jgi:hypothetical protein
MLHQILLALANAILNIEYLTSRFRFVVDFDFIVVPELQ